MSLFNSSKKKKKTAVSPLVRGSAAAGAAAQARAKKSAPKKQKPKQTVQPAKAAASKAPVTKKKTAATSASGRNDSAVRQNYGQRAGTRTSSGAYKPTQSAAYNYKKAETKRSTISTDIKNQTKVKNQKPSVVSGPVKESRDNRDKRMRQSWSQRHPENQVQREQRKEDQRPKSYVPTRGMAIPTIKNKGEKSEWAEFEEGYNKAGILSPNERTGIAEGPLKDRAPLNTSQAKDIDTMLSGGTVPGMYIPDDKKPSALEYSIRMTGQDALSKPYAEEIWKNASVSEKARILKAATETVGFNEQTRRWSDEFQREYGLTSSDEKVKMLGQDKPGLGELMYRDAYDKYKSAVKQQEYVDKWAKDHGYGTSDYMADATNLATATADVGLMNLGYLPLKDITNIERKPGDYFLGGVKAPYEGVSSDKSAFQNLATISNNIVGSVRSIIELPFKGAYYGLNKINPDTDRYVDDFIATHNNVDRVNRDRDEMIMRMNSAVNAGLVGKKSQVAGNIEGFIIQQIPAIATMIAAGPEASSLIGGTTFFGTTAGAYAQSALDSGASLEEAMNYGILGGLGEGATEMIFPMAKGIGGGLLKGGANTVNKRVLFGETVRELEKSGFANSMSGRILRSTIYNGGEATEEMIMEIIDPYLQRASFNPEAENASLAEIGMAGLYGAAVSAVLHIPMGMMNTAQGLTERHGLISNARLYYAAKMREELIAIRGSLEAGLITEEEAEKRTEEVRDKFAAKFAEAKTSIKQPWKATGSLLNEERQGGEYKTSSNLEHLYSSRQEANAATVKPGTSAYFMEDGEVKRITHSEAGVKSEDAVLTNSEKTAYAEKAERLRTAKNNTERTGVQANVRQDIIDQATEMARVYNRNVEFYRDEEAAKRYDDRGRFDPKTETIYVNAATDKPLQTIVSHEMVHAMRNTNAFKELLQKIKTYYKDSYDADVNDIRRMYSERDENGNVIEPSEGIIQEEVVAHFVEKKLLTDEAWVNTFLTNSRTDKILRGINTLLQRGLGGKEARFLAGVRSKWLNALEEERGEQTAPRAEAVAAAKERRQAKGKRGKKKKPSHHYDFTRSFRQQIYDYFDGTGQYRFNDNDTLLVGQTPEILVQCGLPRLPITLSTGHLKNAIFATDAAHQYNEEEIAQLPKAIQNPIAVIRSESRPDDSVVVLINLTDRKDNEIAAIEVGGFGMINKRKIESNAITSFYDLNTLKEKFEKACDNHIKNNDVAVYYINKEATLLLDHAGIKCPGIFQRGGLFGSITDKNSSVNRESKDIVNTSQFRDWFGKSIASKDKEPQLLYYVSKEKDPDVADVNTPLVSSIDLATKRAGEDNTVIPVYASIQPSRNKWNVIDAKGAPAERIPIPKKVRPAFPGYSTVSVNMIRKWAKRMGYDGVRISNVKMDGILTDMYFVNESWQVKRADGIGIYDERIDHIRYAKGSRDSEYLAAVERGDMETAQRMVDEAAREAGYTVETYHGTPETFTVFREYGGREIGYHVGTKSAAEQRVQYELNKNIMRLYTKLGKTIQMPDVFGLWNGIHDYVCYVLDEEDSMVDREFMLREKKATSKYRNKSVFVKNEAFYRMRDAVEKAEKEHKPSSFDRAVQMQREYILSLGIDTISYKNQYESVGSKSYMLMHANQVKSADPVTRHKNGKIILPSERFDENNDDIRYARGLSDLDEEYMAAVETGNVSEQERLVREAAERAGYNIRGYHGTSRGDRVGNVFLPERATSGPMAFFTDNREIAKNYAKDKADTSLAYDSDYDTYESQFRFHNKSRSIDGKLHNAWGYVPLEDRAAIRRKAGQLRFDWDGEDDRALILDEENKEGTGGFQYHLKWARNNPILALEEEWLNSGTLFNEEERFLDVIKMVGITDALKRVGLDVEYKDPNYREEKVYDTFLKIEKPFDATKQVTEAFIKRFEKWYAKQNKAKYEKESNGADFWDKTNVSAELFAERMRYDIENGTTHAWTSIPDSMTDYLKHLKYDGIKDTGGKYTGEQHTVWIPFSSEQIKSADPITRDKEGKVIPLSERFNPEEKDIRYARGQRRSSEAVETAKYHTKKLKYALYNRDRADNKELWDMLRAELNKAYSIGAYDPRIAEKIIDFAYRTGYQLEDNGNERFSLREKISIPEEYRGEMESLGGLAAVNRSIFGTGTVFTYKNNGIAIDEAYDEARDMRPDLFPETDNPSEQVQNIIDALTKVSDKIPLEELDREEDNPFEDSGDPIYNEIRDAVIAAMDDIAAIGRIDMVNRAKREGKNLSAKAQYRKGRESGKKQGQRSGYNTAKREQDRTDRATMREFDKLERQRAIDRAKQENQDRRDDEATMREFDNVMKKVRQDERKLSQQEKKELRKNYESREKDIRAEKNRLIHRLRVEKRSWQDAAERMESERKKRERSLDTKQRQKMRKQQQKLDAERRQERIDAALDADNQRKVEAQEKGTAESLYKQNRSVQRVIDDFRTRILQRAAEMGAFKKEGALILDHNDVAIAKTDDGIDYHLYRDKNVVPSFALTVLAEHEGMKKEDFYGVYAELQKMQNERDEKGNRVYTKRDILEYIVSLKIPASQKSFLYFDVMKYRYDKKPVFKDGGPTKIKPGNYFAGELGEAIDRIGLDMFTGAGVKLATDKSFQIKMENVDELLDMMFTDEEMKEVARTELVQMIADFEADIEEARMIEQTNLLTDNPKEVDSRKLQILSVLRDSKKLFLAEGEAFERFADTVKNPLLAARYYAAKASMSIARDYINGHGIRKLDGTKEKVARTKQNGDEYDVEFVDEKLSLTNIMKPALKGTKESDALLKDLTRYVYAQHNIDRMKYDKGFMELSEEECRAIIDEIGKNKQVVKVADDLVLYGQRLLRLCVESGIISEEDFEYFTTKYPHYVPTFRLREDEVFDRNGNIVRRTNKVIKEAQKSNADLIPLYDQMVRRTQEIVKACKKNQLAAELVKAYNKDGAWDYIIDVRPAEPTSGNEDYIYGIGQIEDRGLKNRDLDGEDNLIPVYLDGVKYNIAVADKNLLYGWDRLNYYRDETSIPKLLRKMNTLRRWVLTQYNPIFWATNGIKDSIDMYLYNQHAERLPLFQVKALSDIFHKKGHDSFAEYLSFGAASSSFFEYDERRRSKARKLKDKAAIPFKGIDFWNFLIEQWPRYTVYLEECDRLTKERKKGKNEYSDEEIKTISAYRAADATVNFGRSGTVVKAANTYGATFLNAGVQGMDRFRRMFTQVKGEKKQETLLNILGLMIKLAAVGLAPSMIADWLYGGNDDDEDKNKLLKFLFGEDAAKVVQEYAEMADYERTNYLNIKLPGMDGWIRIPKGRVVSFIYGWEYNGEKVLSGDMSAMDLLYTQWDLFAENIMPGNPLTNNILQPVLDVAKNRDFWGNEIVSQWEQAQDGFHWTESNEDTSIVARKIAEYLHYIVSGGKEMSPEYIDLSPIKIDYLLQQYGGSWTKLAQPFISAIGDGQDQRVVDMIQDAFKDSMWGKFYLDPVLSNRLAGDYYDLKDEYTGLSDYYGQDTPYAVALKGFKDHDEDLKALRDELNYVSKDASLTWKERLAKMREIREQMNDIYRVGVKDAKSILEYASDIYGGKDMNKDIYDAWQADTKGPDWVIDHMSDSAKVKWDTVKSEYSSADPQNFVDTYNYFSGLKGDKDENGKTVHDSKRQKFVQWLDNQPYSAAEKQTLYTQVGGYKTEATFKDGGSGTTKSNKDALKEKAEEIQANTKYMPVKEARISSEFGMRTHPISGKQKMHTGIDIAVGMGTDVVSARKGVVEFAGSRGGYGNRVVIDHGDGMKTTYSHLSEIGVKPGDTVNAGTLIAKSGSTGASTGPHLHFEVEVNGNYVNPRDFFDFDSWKTVSIAKNPDYSAYTPTKSSSGGGGGRKSGGKKSSGSSGGKKGKATTQAAYTPTYAPTTRSSGSSGSSSGGSSGKSSSKATRTPAARRTQTSVAKGIMLPTAREIDSVKRTSTPTVARNGGKSASRGIVLPTAAEVASAAAGARIGYGSGTSSIRRTNRSRGSFWHENVLG